MKIAIIGTGISGLGAAYLLNPDHEITLFEKNDYAGGHSRTISVAAGYDGQDIPVDTGFIVFNDWNYPNLIGLFKDLNVPFEKSDMSFGVSIRNGWLEYSSSNIFAQARNILRPSFWRMLFDIVKFNKTALKHIEKHGDMTLGQCLDELKTGRWFRDYYLLAMGAAIWSCPLKTMTQFPARTFLQFFKNHGLLNLVRRPQWYTVSGGSTEYVARIAESLSTDIKLNNRAVKVRQDGNKVCVIDAEGAETLYDQVILACHADEALTLLGDASTQEQSILSRFTYQDNKIVVHTDKSFMPKIKKCWASWVYLTAEGQDTKPAVSLSYWMNNLQNFESPDPVLVTLNPDRMPDEDFILDQHEFSHPIFDEGALQSQKDMESIQGVRGIWYCGAYQRYGFHEDGLLSAVNVAKKLGAAIPWE